MPSQFKVIFQFTEADQGFTEVWYRQANNLQDASTIPPSLITASINMRNALTILRKVRVSDTQQLRSSQVVSWNRSATYSGSEPAVAGTACVMAVPAPTIGATRHVWIRGLDDFQVARNDANGQDYLRPQLQTNIGIYFSQLAQANFLVRALQKISPPNYVFRNITNIAGTAGTGIATLTYSGPTVFQANPPTILISQVSSKLWPGLKGSFPALAVGTSTINIAYNMETTGSFPIVKGRFREVNYAYAAFNPVNVSFLKFGTRDTGKSPLGGRGRRPSVHLRLV